MQITLEIPHILGTKKEVILLAIAGLIWVEAIDEGGFGKCYYLNDKQSSTVAVYQNGRYSVFPIDDPKVNDKFIVSFYQNKGWTYSTVISFKKEFGTVQLPVSTVDIITPSGLYEKEEIMKLPPLGRRCHKFRHDFQLKMFKSKSEHCDCEHCELNDDGINTPRFRRIRHKRDYMLDAFLNDKFYKEFLRIIGHRKTSSKREMLNDDDSDDEEIELIPDPEDISVTEKESRYITFKSNIEYPGEPYGGYSSYLFGLNMQSPFGRTLA
ncbi:putative secreted protein [Wickerhamomyces ciferrii]|uniref:Secreted protein n=1 Tax=Wickerhamomyces ciferrii (strain ATCC 14091 / BCRC 22168 / CBS 111 / JCM 3599 / NBRC 0793 / NRRL Y-1031 F-60-10) TaxID=1206466 RepID=K0KYA1_WICCF|nr:uncharacterized protein BN7_6661 [Wickerhamomyces ciferrii]CCH47052.1 putative secreted protein [Wickerhamomyces ciferrii]